MRFHGHDVYNFEGGSGPLHAVLTDKYIHQNASPAQVEFSIKRECKATITNLILENYKLSKKGMPLIPLIFCIARQDTSVNKLVNFKNVATLKNIKSSVTDAELRRCYKIATELGPEFREIAEQTFKYVKVQQDSKYSNLYHLEQIPPLWANSAWQLLWEDRQKIEKKPAEKKTAWREILKKRVLLFHAEHNALPLAQQPVLGFTKSKL